MNSRIPARRTAEAISAASRITSIHDIVQHLSFDASALIDMVIKLTTLTYGC